MSMTIPVLPCASMPETLAFYRTLGFEVTHEQTRPNVYAATRRGDVHLHFMGLKGLKPSESYSTCLVIVPEVEQLHQTFVDGLRQAYGKVPLSGFPRITRMKKGQSRFTVVDVAGNSVIYIRQDAPDDYDESASDNPSQTGLGKALRAAARLRDFKNDDAAAAKVLEAALKKEAGAAFERARVLVARAEIAVAMDDPARATSARAEIATLVLSDDERARIDEELEAIDALERARTR
uniref:Glyoxalase n=1 Tax=Vitiosangium cumulatum TaxID=1867796 RepID=A0A7D5BH09_9BACT|nr:glyoxalase [Vitiosangium cumulatum]